MRQSLTLRDLVGLRTAAWVPAVASSKAIRLRLMGMGRDEAFRDVVNAYAFFLDALAEQRSARVLTQRLETAEQKLSAYEKGSGAREGPEPGNRKEAR